MEPSEPTLEQIRKALGLDEVAEGETVPRVEELTADQVAAALGIDFKAHAAGNSGQTGGRRLFDDPPKGGQAKQQTDEPAEPGPLPAEVEAALAAIENASKLLGDESGLPPRGPIEKQMDWLNKHLESSLAELEDARRSQTALINRQHAAIQAFQDQVHKEYQELTKLRQSMAAGAGRSYAGHREKSGGLSGWAFRLASWLSGKGW